MCLLRLALCRCFLPCMISCLSFSFPLLSSIGASALQDDATSDLGLKLSGECHFRGLLVCIKKLELLYVYLNCFRSPVYHHS